MNKRGFTLIEIIIAMAIISTFIGAFLTFYSNATKTAIESRNRLQALTLAQNIMEYIKANAIEWNVPDKTFGKWINEYVGYQKDSNNDYIKYEIINNIKYTIIIKEPILKQKSSNSTLKEIEVKIIYPSIRNGYIIIKTRISQ